jgi:DNA helicase-2/ATP-dependent DNA helicase PcrA
MRQFLTKANPNQVAAIEHDTGPLLLIAGPGSGKTFTLVERVVYLITQKQITPEHILIRACY